MFDLDGTLVDSLRDIAESVNDSLELLGLPPRPIDDYRFLVGEGIPKLCDRAVPASHADLAARLAELTRARYRVRPLRHTRPYPGVPDLVERLAGAGVRLAVLSNKPQDMTTYIVAKLWPSDPFERVVGYSEEQLRKPDPTCLLRICQQLDAPPAHAWLVGDTAIDVDTAKRAGVVSIGVTWGFRPRRELEEAGADHIVDKPAEIG
ncbi:MAG: HAD family hydrolase [Phycisphaerae bacterium]